MELFKIFGSILVDDKEAMKSLGKTRKEARETQDAANRLGDAGRKIGTAFMAGGALVGTAMVASTIKTVSAMDDIDKASQRSGMHAEEFQRWGHVAELNGIEMTTFEKAAARNQKTMAEASQGAGKAADSYKALGINVEGMNSDQVFEEVIMNLSEMDDETQRNAIANDIFGRSFADLAPLLNNTSDEIREQKGELDKLGAVMTEDQVKAGAALNDSITRIKEMFGALVFQIGSELIPVFQSIADWVMEHKDEIQEGFATVLEKIGDAIDWVKENANWLIPVLEAALGAFVAFNVVATIVPLIQAMVTVFKGLRTGTLKLNTAMLANPAVWMAVIFAALVAAGILVWRNWDTIKEKAIELKDKVVEKFTELKENTLQKFEELKTKTKEKWAQIKDDVVNSVKETWQNVKNKVAEMKNGVIAKWEEVKTQTKAKWEATKEAIVTPIRNAWNSVKTIANNIYTSVKNKFNQVKSSVTNTWNSIRDAIMNPINRAKNTVKTAIDKIKGFMNFKWAFPKLKMPHFSVSGSANPLKWLKEGTPKVAVDWYKKGGIMTEPTAFGMSGNRVQAGGEAGPEAILPLTNSVLGGIGKGITSAMQDSNPVGTGDLIFNLTIKEFNNKTDEDVEKLSERLAFLVKRKLAGEGIGIA